MEKFDKKIKKLKALLPKALVADRMAGAREIERLTRRKTKSLTEDKMRARLDRLEKRLQASADRRTRRVSLTFDGLEGDNRSFSAAISADGQWVAFTSIAENLVPNDTNNALDIFVIPNPFVP